VIFYAVFTAKPSPMRLLVDTDAFCKLAIGELLCDGAKLFGADLSECGRLPALAHMLRRGKLVRTYGPANCTSLISLADRIPAIEVSDSPWLDRLALAQAIDPGEAQLLALAAESGLLLLSGDKRALRALNDVPGICDALAGRVIVLEAVLLALCDELGAEVVRTHAKMLDAYDIATRICFSDGVADPREGLLSYYRSFATEVPPTLLWNPQPRW